MNKDKLIRIFTALVILLAILFFSVGKWTYSGIAILAALAIHTVSYTHLTLPTILLV